ncbi:hypothetical protein STENM223S_03491 [Streptomyces tendae]
MTQVQHGRDGQGGDEGKHPAGTDAVGQCPDRDPAERADEHRHGHHE